MASSNQQIERISQDQELGILQFANKAHTLLLNQFSIRQHLIEIDRYYMREGDYTEAQIRNRLASRSGDKKKIQNLTVPVVMPAVESAVAYFANVFATGYPTFGMSSDPSQEDAALQMETIIAENSITAGWVRELVMFFRDGLKYNLHGLECSWEQKNVANIENDPAAANSAKVKNTLWKGNVLRRMDLYNTFFDPRVHPAEIHSEGEYAGYITMMSRVRMKKFINDLFGLVSPDRVIRAFQSSPSATNMGSSMGTPFAYFQPIINPFPLMDRQNQQTFDWLAWAEAASPANKRQIRYTNVYEVMKLFARIIPADFGFKVPEPNTPQVWKFIIINGTVVLYAERQTNAHNFIPIIFGQPIEDGLDYQTKSFATNVVDMQDIASAMWNGYLASKRRLVGDRVLYDPLRVREKDISSTSPTAKIPVRPSAYGKPLNEAVYAFPFHDEQTKSLLEGSEAVRRFAELITGQNPAQQGQFVPGNKTLKEYQDVMGHGNDRQQVMAIMTDAQVLTPMKEVIKLNILQYQEETQLYNREQKQTVNVQPTDLRKAAVHFKVSDGLLPIEKEMSTDEFQTALQTLGSSPQLAGSYNMGPLFTYIMKLRGADLSPFEKPQWQVMYEQQMQAWQMAAQQAAKAGTAFNTPMPQLPPQLQQLAQQQQQAGKTQNEQDTEDAEESTQGNDDAQPAPTPPPPSVPVTPPPKGR